MKLIADICLKIWIALIVILPFAYWAGLKLSSRSIIRQIAIFFVSLSQLTIGIFGIVTLLLWWGTHLKGSWIDALSFVGYLGLGIIILFAVIFLIVPFSR